jgi:hypothetical protein
LVEFLSYIKNLGQKFIKPPQIGKKARGIWAYFGNCDGTNKLDNVKMDEWMCPNANFPLETSSQEGRRPTIILELGRTKNGGEDAFFG